MVYKLIDAQSMDNAMVATADAIRAVTGIKERIKWDDDIGFAHAIPAATRIEYGGFSTEYTDWDCPDPVTVSGLPFTPTRVIAFALFNYDNNLVAFDVNLLYAFDVGADGGHILYSANGYVHDDIENFSITLNNDGFTINILCEEGTNNFDNYISGGDWRYIAFG
ncbi:MAG: hypothetical protein ACI3XI_07320 [Eubacteriales bacterium]